MSKVNLFNIIDKVYRNQVNEFKHDLKEKLSRSEKDLLLTELHKNSIELKEISYNLYLKSKHEFTLKSQPDNKKSIEDLHLQYVIDFLINESKSILVFETNYESLYNIFVSVKENTIISENKGFYSGYFDETRGNK